jgi:hypothetical protein
VNSIFNIIDYVNGNGNSNRYSNPCTEIHSINTPFPFPLLSPFQALSLTLNHDKSLLICIIVLVIILFFLCLLNVDEVGYIYLETYSFIVLPLLGLACAITCCLGRGLE